MQLSRHKNGRMKLALSDSCFNVSGDGMKKLAAFLLMGFLLAGCATVRESYGPDGRKAYSLNCSGTARGWDKCFAAAGEICGAAGYDVLDRNSEDVVAGSYGSSANVNRTSGSASSAGFIGKTNERSMLISCKQPKE